MDRRLDVHRLQLDAHVRCHRADRRLLADRERRRQDVAGAGRVAGTAGGGMQAGADHELREPGRRHRAVPRVVEVAGDAARGRRDAGGRRVLAVAVAERRLDGAEVDLVCHAAILAPPGSGRAEAQRPLASERPRRSSDA